MIRRDLGADRDQRIVAYAELGGPIVLRRMSDGFTGPVMTPSGLNVDRITWFADGSVFGRFGLRETMRSGER